MRMAGANEWLSKKVIYISDTAVSWYIGIMSDGLIPGWDLFGPPQMTGVGWSSACALHAHVTFWVFTTTI